MTLNDVKINLGSLQADLDLGNIMMFLVLLAETMFASVLLLNFCTCIRFFVKVLVEWSVLNFGVHSLCTDPL